MACVTSANPPDHPDLAGQWPLSSRQDDERLEAVPWLIKWCSLAAVIALPMGEAGRRSLSESKLAELQASTGPTLRWALYGTRSETSLASTTSSLE